MSQKQAPTLFSFLPVERTIGKGSPTLLERPCSERPGPWQPPACAARGYLPAGSSHLGSSRPNEAPRWRCPLEWHRPPHRGNMSIPALPKFQDGEQTAGVLRPKAVGWLPYISSKRSPAHHCPVNTPKFAQEIRDPVLSSCLGHLL